MTGWAAGGKRRREGGERAGKREASRGARERSSPGKEIICELY